MRMTLVRSLPTTLQRVINATGVVVHTNLGRAPLSDEARAAMASVANGYSTLEFDVPSGLRGSRHTHLDPVLREATGSEAGLATNNTAAGLTLALSAIAAGREVILSRGELVEIGGGFRVPEILRGSGALLREVGTTNRTRAADYAAAISERTAAILRVHPSNFRMEGFTERPALTELVALARKFSVPLIEDQGSGWLGFDLFPPDAFPADVRTKLAREPAVRDSIRGAMPRRPNSARYTRLGITIATYWSPAITLSPMHVPITDAMRRPVVFAAPTTGRMSRSRKPADSMMAAKERAPSTSQMVKSIEDIPPREKSASMVSLPVLETKPVASAA